MTSLPKRGDRVRVTEHHPVAGYGGIGSEHVLAADAVRGGLGDYLRLRCRDGSTEYNIEHVKVEILERAGSATVDDETWINAGCPSPPPVHPEFARGMRRAVAIAREIEANLGQFEEFLVFEMEKAVEKELKNVGTGSLSSGPEAGLSDRP